MPRSAHATAARMVRGSVPSGRTTSASAARASSTSWYRNAAGLNRRGRDVLVSDSSQDGSSASAIVLRHALDPFGVVDRQARVEVPHPGRGLVAVGLDEQNGQAGGPGGPGELADLRIGRGPRAQQQGGQVGSAQLGQVGGHDHFVPVAGDHDQPPGVQDADAARDAPGHHRHVPDPPGQVPFVQDLRIAARGPGRGPAATSARGGAARRRSDGAGAWPGRPAVRRPRRHRPRAGRGPRNPRLAPARRTRIRWRRWRAARPRCLRQHPRARCRPARRRHPASGPAPDSANWRTAFEGPALSPSTTTTSDSS